MPPARLLPLFAPMLLLPALDAGAAPVLRAADVRVSFTGPSSCAVEAAYTVEADAADELEHRIESRRGTSIARLEVDGRAVEASVIGSTQSFVLALKGAGLHTYRVRYAVTQPDAWAYRCPLPLPAAPTDGVSREVDVSIDLPPEASPGGGSLPALAWARGRGLATLPHLPAVVRVPFAAPADLRQMPGSDIGRLMDGTAMVILAGATLFWIWRRRR